MGEERIYRSELGVFIFCIVWGKERGLVWIRWFVGLEVFNRRVFFLDSIFFF